MLLIRSLIRSVLTIAGGLKITSFLWKFLSELYYLLGIVGFGGFIRRFKSVAITPEGKIVYRPFLPNDVLMISGMYEPYVNEVFKPEKGTIVLDIGAYIGYYTLRASKATGSRGKVIAIEPNPESFSILRENIKNNKLDNVIILNCAVGQSNGNVDLYISSHDCAASTTSPTMADQYKCKSRIKVHMITIDKLMQRLRIDRMDWMKIDIEGGELDALQGCQKIMKKSKNLKIVIETGSEEALHFLVKLGFSVRPLKGVNYYFASRVD